MIDRSCLPIFTVQPEPQRIAVFRALYLGDLLCATPALRALQSRFPHAEITLIGLPWARELVDRLPYIDKFSLFPGYEGIIEVPFQPERTAKFLSEARAISYDLAIQMHGDGRISNGFVADLDAFVSLGYRRVVPDGSRGGVADSRLTLTLPGDPDEHEVIRLLRLSAVLGAESADFRLEFPTTAAEEARAARLLAPFASYAGPTIGLHVGAKDVTRRWPSRQFAALADLLCERHGARIVLTGSEAERDLTAAVRGAMRHPALDIAARTDLGAFAALIGRLDLLVTNDTGASHFAAAAGTPSVVLFGPEPPGRWAPLDRERHRVVDARALLGPQVDPSLLLRQLPVAPVAQACDEMLREAAQRFV